MMSADVNGSHGDDDDDDNENDDDSTESLILIKSKIINFYQLSHGQFGIPNSEGFFPARKKGTGLQSKPMKWSNSGHKDEISEETNKLTTRDLGETNTSWKTFLSPR